MKNFHPTGTCPIRDVLCRLGDKWSMLVLVTLNANGTMRFGDIHKTIDVISQRILTDTLRTLEADGLVERKAYAEVPLVLWIVLAADLCVFAILGPVAHANKPLTAVQKKRNKRNGFLVLGIGSLLAFLWRSCVIVGTVYIGTVTFVAVLAMIGKRKVGTRYEED